MKQRCRNQKTVSLIGSEEKEEGEVVTAFPWSGKDGSGKSITFCSNPESSLLKEDDREGGSASRVLLALYIQHENSVKLENKSDPLRRDRRNTAVNVEQRGEVGGRMSGGLRSTNLGDTALEAKKHRKNRERWKRLRACTPSVRKKETVAGALRASETLQGANLVGNEDRPIPKSSA